MTPRLLEQTRTDQLVLVIDAEDGLGVRQIPTCVHNGRACDDDADRHLSHVVGDQVVARAWVAAQSRVADVGAVQRDL